MACPTRAYRIEHLGRAFHSTRFFPGHASHNLINDKAFSQTTVGLQCRSSQVVDDKVFSIRLGLYNVVHHVDTSQIQLTPRVDFLEYFDDFGKLSRIH